MNTIKRVSNLVDERIRHYENRKRNNDDIWEDVTLSKILAELKSIKSVILTGNEQDKLSSDSTLQSFPPKLLVKDLSRASMTPISYTGDWIDLRMSRLAHYILPNITGTNSIKVKEGSEIKMFFGVAIQLPKNHEAIIKPRGSLFRKTGLIFASSGVIDEGYNGDKDEWFATFYATRDIELVFNERYCQFRIQEKQPFIDIRHVEELGNENRGGDGSTGRM